MQFVKNVYKYSNRITHYRWEKTQWDTVYTASVRSTDIQLHRIPYRASYNYNNNDNNNHYNIWMEYQCGLYDFICSMFFSVFHGSWFFSCFLASERWTRLYNTMLYFCIIVLREEFTYNDKRVALYERNEQNWTKQ